MRRFIYLSMALLVALVATSSSASAWVPVGQKGDIDLNLGAILQAGFTYHMEDSANVDAFWLKRARLLAAGTVVPDRVKYFVQTDFVGDRAILDYKASFFYVPKTEIAFGRFLPNYTLYMPVSTAKLELINYPITTMMTGMWRQVGVQTTTTLDMVDFNLGLFNGADIPNNMSDNNDAKDYFVRADIKPPVGEGKLRVGGFYWMNNEPATAKDEEEDTYSNTSMGFFAKMDHPLNEMMLRVRGEYVMHTSESGDVDDPDEEDSAGFFAQLGLQINEMWEVLGRFETWDPNTENDNEVMAGSEDDASSIITVGVNHYLSGINAMIYLNYINISYEDDDIDSEGMIQGQVQVAL